MTDEALNLIRSHMADSTLRWNVLVLQTDLARLLSEVDRLRSAITVNAHHAQCPTCGAGVDVVPPPGTTVPC